MDANKNANQNLDVALSKRLDHLLQRLTPLVSQEGYKGKPLTQRMKEQGIRGLQCGVCLAKAEESEIQVRSFGTNDLGQPIINNTVGECASLSKPIAASWIIEYCVTNDLDIHATSANSLIERGIQLNGVDHFSGWRVRDNNGQLADIPIARFLSHTSGVGGHYVNGCKHDQEVQHPLSILRGEELDGYPTQSKFQFRCAAGTEMNYSGTSYILIEMLTIHLANGTSYPDVVDPFLKLFGMKHSTFDHNKIPEANDGVASATLLLSDYLKFPSAAAGMYTTPADFIRFTKGIIDAFHGREAPISQATAKLMLTAAMRQREFIGLDPGHGFFVIDNDDNSITFAHQGANEGFRILMIANTNGPIIYVVSNSDLGTPLNCEIARNLMVELGFPKYFPVQIPKVDLTAGKLEQLIGTYATEDTPDPKWIVIEPVNGDLVRTYSVGTSLLFCISPDHSKFVHSGTGQMYRFDQAKEELALTDVNNRAILAHRIREAGKTETPIFDDRQYVIDDPAKLVNLQIRDLLDLNGKLRSRLQNEISSSLQSDKNSSGQHNLGSQFE